MKRIFNLQIHCHFKYHILKEQKHKERIKQKTLS